jgi:transmembrane sensor
MTTLDEEAADWVVRLNSDQRTQADLDAFGAWLGQGEAQRRAYADSASLWVGVGLLADDEAAREILLRPRPIAVRRPVVSRRWAIAGGFGAAAAAALAAVVAVPTLTARTWRTRPGEQRRLTLADGSEVLLDTDSELRVSLGRAERVLFLDRGQAFFRVAKDPHRPFRVFAGAEEVRALGTAFGVRRTGQGARVTLEEGRLGIFTARASAPARTDDRPAALLVAGEQAVLRPQVPPQVGPADLRRALAWRSGRLILEDSPLSEAAAELNRYGAPRIVMADSEAGRVRVSGVFHIGDRGAFVESVIAAFPLEVVRQDADEIVLAHRS